VRIGHDSTSRAQALLYAGWLTARLGWTVEEPFARGPAPWRAALKDARGRVISVSLHPDREFADGAGSLVLTMLVARGGDAAFSIGRKDDRNTIMAISESESGIITRRVLPLDVPDEAALLSDELDVLGRDGVYEGTLQAVAALVGEA
jgi:glucose-6-phosphate dehydrogenase assembly protein OpcA